MRSINIAAVVAAVALCGQPSKLPAQQGEAWQDFWQKTQKLREQRAQGLRDWWPNTRRDYQRWPQDGARKDTDVAIQLEDTDIAPGDYRVQLPLGVDLRVQVRPASGQPLKDSWPTRVYQEVNALTAGMSANLQWLRYGVQQMNQRNLQARTEEAQKRLEELRQAAARRRPGEDLRQSFRGFDEAWHHLAHDLNALGQPAWMRSRVATLADQDEQLHRLLQLAPAPVYDRLRVAAATQYLLRHTQALVNLEYDPRSADDMDMRRLAQRVHRHAEDLAQAVRRNASLADIAGEFRRFDEPWHQLRDHPWPPSNVRSRFREVAQSLRPAHAALHADLEMNPPLVLDQDRLRALVEQIESGADHLARDLEYDLDRDPRDLIDAARRLVYAADRLGQQLERGSTAKEARADIDYMFQAWTEFERRVPKEVNEQRFAHTLAAYRQLKQDVAQLQQLIS